MRRPHRHHTRPLHRARGLRERGQTIDHGARRRHGRHMLRSQSGIRVCTVTLSDTRQVDCVITAGTYGKSGVTCDWSHVSGADKEPR